MSKAMVVLVTPEMDISLQFIDKDSMYKECCKLIQCSLVERVSPKRLYEELNYSYKPTSEEGSSIVMLVDESGLYREDNFLNPIGSYLYEFDKHRNPIVGPIVFIGEYVDEDGEITSCGLKKDVAMKLIKDFENMKELSNKNFKQFIYEVYNT